MAILLGVIFSFSKMVKNFCYFRNFSIISEFDLNPAIKGRGLAHSKTDRIRSPPTFSLHLEIELKLYYL